MAAILSGAMIHLCISEMTPYSLVKSIGVMVPFWNLPTRHRHQFNIYSMLDQCKIIEIMWKQRWFNQCMPSRKWPYKSVWPQSPLSNASLVYGGLSGSCRHPTVSWHIRFPGIPGDQSELYDRAHWDSPPVYHQSLWGAMGWERKLSLSQRGLSRKSRWEGFKHGRFLLDKSRRSLPISVCSFSVWYLMNTTKAGQLCVAYVCQMRGEISWLTVI
jgi:hypothetical protein